MEKPMTDQLEVVTEVQTPCGLNHLVLNVRDLEESHRFWTECLGFKQVGSVRPSDAGGRPRVAMRFYSGELDGKLRHHDIALVERTSLPTDLAERPQAFNHVAIAYPTREAWERQIRFLIMRGMTLYRQIDRGVTQSIHLADPDIEAALNRAVERPVGG
jgi:catechol 2,3-dioxygenase